MFMDSDEYEEYKDEMREIFDLDPDDNDDRSRKKVVDPAHQADNPDVGIPVTVIVEEDQRAARRRSLRASIVGEAEGMEPPGGPWGSEGPIAGHMRARDRIAEFDRRTEARIKKATFEAEERARLREEEKRNRHKSASVIIQGGIRGRAARKNWKLAAIAAEEAKLAAKKKSVTRIQAAFTSRKAREEFRIFYRLELQREIERKLAAANAAAQKAAEENVVSKTGNTLTLEVLFSSVFDVCKEAIGEAQNEKYGNSKYDAVHADTWQSLELPGHSDSVGMFSPKEAGPPQTGLSEWGVEVRGAESSDDDERGSWGSDDDQHLATQAGLKAVADLDDTAEDSHDRGKDKGAKKSVSFEARTEDGEGKRRKQKRTGHRNRNPSKVSKRKPAPLIGGEFYNEFSGKLEVETGVERKERMKAERKHRVEVSLGSTTTIGERSITAFGRERTRQRVKAYKAEEARQKRLLNPTREDNSAEKNLAKARKMRGQLMFAAAMDKVPSTEEFLKNVEELSKYIEATGVLNQPKTATFAKADFIKPVWSHVPEWTLPGQLAGARLDSFEMRQAHDDGPLPEARKAFWRSAPPGYTRSVQRTPQSKGVMFPIPVFPPAPVRFEAKRGSSLSLAIVDSSQMEANEARKKANEAMMATRSNEGDVPDWCSDDAVLKQKMKGEVIDVVNELREKGQEVRRFRVSYKPYW